MKHVLTISQFTCTLCTAFVRYWNEPYLPFPSQLKPVLIYRPQKDGRLSWPELRPMAIYRVYDLQETV